MEILICIYIYIYIYETFHQLHLTDISGQTHRNAWQSPEQPTASETQTLTAEPNSDFCQYFLLMF